MIEIRGFLHRYDTEAPDRSTTYARGSLWPWIAQHRTFRLLGRHDPEFPLACCRDGTLEVFDTDQALGFRALLPLGHLALARDVARGRIGCSIGEAQALRHHGDRITLAIVKEASLVEEPAYPGTAAWLAEYDPRDHLPAFRALAAEWRAGYQANMRPQRTGVDLIDGPNGYQAERKPRPQQPAAAPAPATVAGAWPWRSSIVCHRNATHWAIRNRSCLAAR